MEKDIDCVAAAKDACSLKELIDTEVYYGFNLGFVLADATQAERDAVRKIFQRCADERARLKAKRTANG